MPIRLDARDADFPARFRAFLDTKREASADVEQAVRAIIADVAARGDAALIELTKKFDRVDLGAIGLRVTPAELEAATAACEPAPLDALKLARDRIEAYHRRQLPQDDRWTDPLGVELGHRWTAIEAVGLYVPGGTAAYPSSVLMNAVPAKVAGCPRIVMVVPAPDGKLNPLVLAAAHSSPAWTRSIGSAARRRWRRSPTAPRPSRRSPRSSDRAMPMWRRPSAWCSARSAST